MTLEADEGDEDAECERFNLSLPGFQADQSPRQ